jgi:hypothetical protein
MVTCKHADIIMKTHTLGRKVVCASHTARATYDTRTHTCALHGQVACGRHAARRAEPARRELLLHHGLLVLSQELLLLLLLLRQRLVSLKQGALLQMQVG